MTPFRTEVRLLSATPHPPAELQYLLFSCAPHSIPRYTNSGHLPENRGSMNIVFPRLFPGATAPPPPPCPQPQYKANNSPVIKTLVILLLQFTLTR
jgi:hypothetical protein